MNTIILLNYAVKKFFNGCLHHPFMMILIGGLTLFYTIQGTSAATTAPEQAARTEIAQLIVSTGTKIVNIEEGCHAQNAFTALLPDQNAKRIEDADKLLSIVTADTSLSDATKQELTRFIEYNNALSQQATICSPSILSKSAVITWEHNLINHL